MTIPNFIASAILFQYGLTWWTDLLTARDADSVAKHIMRAAG